jgi:Fur family zinc uptake transcriptional regulator
MEVCLDKVAAALDRAAAGCVARGAQLTPLRRDVLALMLRAEQPIGAYALLDQLKASRAGAAPPTIYRALDFLLAQGLVHKLESLNAYVPCVHDHAEGMAGGHHHPHQFLICGRCGVTAEICDPALTRALDTAASRAGFTVARATVELEGLCQACAAR